MHRHTTQRLAAIALAALFGAGTHFAFAQQGDEGAKVGNWKTWHFASAAEIDVPAPPAEASEQTKTELNELRILQAIRGPILNRLIENWNGVPATQRWTDIANRIPANGPRSTRIAAYVTTAMFDAAVVAYRAKHAYNRRAPGQVAGDLTPAFATVGGPSYPSEHAAIAGAGAAMLAFFNPAEAKSYEAMAQEAALSRLAAGVNYRSDIEEGLRLGRAVAAKAIARAQSDGGDAKWTGSVPTGPGLWVGTNPVEPLAGAWRTWNLTSGSQIRPGPPPAFGSPEFLRELEEVKRVATLLTPIERAQAQFWITNGWVPIWETAHALMAREKVSPARAARISALMATSAADGVISVWDVKYVHWSIRPSQADPTIQTLIPVPSYPAYSSGFSAITGGLTEVMAYAFPQEAIRLRTMGRESAFHRFHEGIHYRSDIEVGLRQGIQAAEIAIQRDQITNN
jgi:membrane-associated phospholipid phosphatase